MTTQAQEGMIPTWTVGDRLRKARMANSWTVAEFALLALCSEKTVNNYEGDKVTNRRPLLMEKWASVTGVSLTWIETGVDSGHNPDGGPSLDAPVRDTPRYSLVALHAAA